VIPPGVDYSCIGETALERAAAAQRFTGPVAGQGLGSNNWVIAGSRTTSGKPLLANDMHLAMSIPSIWYENHLVGGDLDLSGISFPSTPGIVAGHNGHVAWGFTNGFPDVQDLYMEDLRRTAEGGVQYRFRDEWLDAQVYTEPIRVKGGATETQEVIVTRHGPIINALAPDLCGEQPLAMRWTALEPGALFDCLYRMNQAHSCAEFREALRAWTVPTQNTVYADVHGDIGYSFPGKIPIRAKGDGRLPVPGWSGEYEWTGYIPFEELPHLINPPQGYIATANNRVVGPDYPYYFGVDHISANRARRIVELIGSQAQIDPAFIQRMQFDQLSPAARQIAAHLGALQPKDPELAAVVARLREWDGRLEPGSPAAAIYEVFVPRAIQHLLSAPLGDLALRYLGKGPTPVLMESSLFGERAREWLREVLADPASPWFDLGDGRSRDEILEDILRETVAFLKSELGPEITDWAWSRLHQIKFTHTLGQVQPLDRLFNRGPFPLGGDGDTVWATGSSALDLTSQAVVGPPFRFIADLSDLGQCQGLLAPGQSGQPASPHYADNLRAWFEAGYHPMLYRRAEVESGAASRLQLEPDK
jgi:penicillin amidase